MAKKWICVALTLALPALALAPSETKAAMPAGYGAVEAPNYYVSSADNGGVTAALYPSPRPTPPLVGQTYITYEPLSPHEFLYQHHRSYARENPDGKITRVHVSWHHHFELGPSLMWGTPALLTPPAVSQTPLVP